MSLIHVPHTGEYVQRGRTFAAVLMLSLLLVLVRLWFLQIVQGDEMLRESEVNQTRLIRRMAPRGLIQDRNGVVLATNRSSMVVSVVPDTLRTNTPVLRRLAILLNVDPEDLAFTIQHNKTTEYDPVAVEKDVSMSVATLIEERQEDLPGVLVESQPVRYYPTGPAFGHMMGEMGQISPSDLKSRAGDNYRPGDYCGKLGLERAWDHEVRGTDGGEQVQVDARGRIRQAVRELAAAPGATLKLGVDSQLQTIGYSALSQLAANGKPCAAVAMDPQTGEVLALVSAPSYNPNLFARGIKAPDWKALLTDPLNPLIDRSVSGGTAPGSTFKLITGTAGLETGATTPQTITDCTGVIYLGKWAKRCHILSGHGPMDLQSALQKSCDVYFYKLGQRLGPERLALYARGFGLGRRTEIDLARPGDPQVESSGLVPDPEYKRKRKLGPWVGGDTVDYAIGQSLLKCTPLQMCNIAAAIGNGGTLYRPHLVHSLVWFDPQSERHTVTRVAPSVLGKLPASAATLQQIVRGMRAVMAVGGTGATIRVPGVEIAGKTGTAQMRLHGKMVDNAWFIGYAPVDNPRIAVCVYIQEGGHGGDEAGQIAASMMRSWLQRTKGQLRITN